uniref:Spalt like transcription factor 4 n=1 Tax=Latimeria chalumnae TaxID=7897 RepID=H3B1K9_LATCH
EETNICDKCCAEFFDQSEFQEHKKSCTKNPPVLIMNDGEGVMPPDNNPETSTDNLPSDPVESRNTNEIHSKNSASSIEKQEEDTELETDSEVYQKPDHVGALTAPDVTLPKTQVPNTNVTLETMQTTKVAVTQHASESLSTPTASFSTIPMILEQLVCLQQQQLQQIQLTEQIRIQIAMMAPHSLHPSIAAAADPLKALGAHLSQQLSAAAALIGQKAGSQSLSFESLKQGTVAASSGASVSKSNTYRGVPNAATRFPSSLLPQSPGSVISSNPLSSVSATLEALKKGKGKPPNISIEGKSNPEESFFKHKCKFCSKVFGNDSALQIHLRSHTGERPYKCNICGNRFTTKGNLKVHFQRHKEKYPHIKMNPYPVPEHLDSVPTSNGIPYGMSVPLDIANLVCADSKPVASTLVGITLPQNLSILANRKDSQSGIIPHDIPQRASPSESEGGSTSSTINQESGADQSLDSPHTSASVDCGANGGNDEQDSETSKLQQLVENIDKTTSDPNECLICHRVLSCQSSKICGRAFSTKGNLKTHYSVHRANTPLRMQHSCPICQKKFTNAVVLQQHIRMHMGGQIPNTPLPEGSYEGPDVEPGLLDDKSVVINSRFTDETLDDEVEGENKSSVLPGSSSRPPTSYSEVQSGSPSVVCVLENQVKIINSALNLQRQISLKSNENGLLESDGMTNDTSMVVDQDYQNGRSPAASETASFMASPANSYSGSNLSKLPGFTSHEDAAGVGNKTEPSDNSIDLENDGALDLTSGTLTRKMIKEEPGSLVFFLCLRESGSNTPVCFVRAPTSLVKIEASTTESPLSTVTPQFIAPIMTSSMAPILVPPPRRTAKQHICPTICGRAFTTKGNLKVHVGTHMWNNSARRGRRLSVDNPMVLLGNDAKKAPEMFPKEMVPPPMNIDPAVWNQYAAMLSNGLAMKTNEISVIQNGGIPSLPVSLGGNSASSSTSVPRMDTSQSSVPHAISDLEKTAAESVPKHQFPHFVEENKIAVS